MIDLRVAASSGPTGRVLRSLLESAGHRVEVRRDSLPDTTAPVVVSYGMRGRWGVPTLNAESMVGDKFSQLSRMREAGVPVPDFWLVENGQIPEIPAEAYPLLARKRKHRGGKDIRVVLQPEEVPWRVAAGAEALVRFTPWKWEHRVWVYRGRHLGTYRKVQAHPEQYRWTGMNQRNGFAFVLVPSEEVDRALVDTAAKAVDAIRLDFGAVDVLTGKDEVNRVLEVNTAPGVEGDARQAVRLLAGHISRWASNPTKRKGRD